MFDQLTETISCPVCGSEDYKLLRPAHYPLNLSKQALVEVYSSSSDQVLFDQLVQCHGCSLVYLNPRIKENVILEGYSSAVDPTFVRQDEYRIRTFKRSLQGLVRRYGINPSRSLRVLDVGCAGGAFPKAAADVGFAVVGVEPSRWLAERGRNHYGLDIRPGTLADQNFQDESFDIVTLWDVIEHLTSPGKVIDDVHRILKGSGLLIVNYPDYASMARRILGEKWPFFLSVHLVYFAPNTIRKFLNNHGFEVVEIRPFFQTLELGYVLRRAGTYFDLFNMIERFVSAIRLSHLPVTYNMGQSFLVARKA